MHFKVETINLDQGCVRNWVEKKSGHFLLAVKSGYWCWIEGFLWLHEKDFKT